jgi:hypothetical protein
MDTPIFETEWDLCSKTECPIVPGKLDIHYGQTLPPIAPPVRTMRYLILRKYNVAWNCSMPVEPVIERSDEQMS